MNGFCLRQLSRVNHVWHNVTIQLKHKLPEHRLLVNFAILCNTHRRHAPQTLNCLSRLSLVCAACETPDLERSITCRSLCLVSICVQLTADSCMASCANNHGQGLVSLITVIPNLHQIAPFAFLISQLCRKPVETT